MLKGFTLVELLIVVSIIAVLSVVGLVSYTNFLSNSRDAKRKADLSFIQSSLEQFHADQKFYPKQQAGRDCASLVNGRLHMILWSECPLKDPSGTRTYLNKVPKDPSSSTTSPYNYKYVGLYGSSTTPCDNSTVLCTSYCLFARMENSVSAVSIPTQCSTSLPAGHNYVVTPP